MQEPEKLISQTQLAAMLGVSERTVQRLVRRGLIPHERVGNTPVFRTHLVEAVIDAFRRKNRHSGEIGGEPPPTPTATC